MPNVVARDIDGVSPLTAPQSRMITEKQGEGKIDVDADIAYFKKKLAEGLANGEDVTKLERQISLLEDAMVTYQLTGQR